MVMLLSVITVHIHRNIKIIFLAGFAYKVVCIDNKYSKKVKLYGGKNTVYRFIKSIRNGYNYCRKVMKKYFCKNLTMSAEENERFELTNICWICSKLIDGDEKVRDACHISRKYRGAAHWNCNINLKISKKFPVMFHNLKGYNSHLIFKELSKFNNLKISAIPNGLNKYISFTINKNLVFIDSMQFMNSSLYLLVKNLNDKDFKYLSEEFIGDQLKLVKEKGIYPYEYMNSFKRFNEDELPDKSKFFSLLKDTGINEKEYDGATKVWKVFKIKNLGEYHDLYLKTEYCC